MRCLGKVYDHPGECPVCHMKLNLISKVSARVRPHASLWPMVEARTAIYFRPYTVKKVQVDRLLRVAGTLKGRTLRASLAPGQIQGLKAGSSAMVTPPQGYSRPMLASVTAIGPGGALTIRCPRAMPGTPYALAEIRLPGALAVAVPLEALSENGAEPRVFVKRGEGYVPQAVTVTFRGESFAAVSGLAEGETVAGAGVFWIESQWRMEHP